MANKNDIETRLQALRILMKESDLIGYLVPSGDEFLGEFIPPCARRLEYITGFTGSNGFAVILLDRVLFFTDGRYLQQAGIQLDSKIFEIFDLKDLRSFEWNKYLAKQIELLSSETSAADPNSLHSSEKRYYIGFDPKIFTSRFIAALSAINSSNIKLQATSIPEGRTNDLPVNLIDRIWDDQPAKPNSQIYDYPIAYAGTSRQDKITNLQNALCDKGADAIIVTNPEEVCWLLNIRANDLEFTPLLLAYAIVTKTNTYLLCDAGRLEEKLAASMSKQEISLVPLIELQSLVDSIDGVILYDPNFASYHVSQMLEARNISSGIQDNNDEHKSSKKSPGLIQKWKAIKNESELKWMQEGHIQDGVAVIEMLSFLDSCSSEDLASMSEYDVSVMLTAHRAKRQGYVMDSFPTIAGFRENGAVIHYRPYENTAKKLVVANSKGEITPGLLLIDSGGQYMGATTDITRVVMLGGGKARTNAGELSNSDTRAELVSKYKKFYTKVLKGHLQLGMIKFPAGNVSGANLDVLARQYLWQSGLDYGHGTGHGVGSFLSVHEGPCSISLINSCPIETGMVLSNEPGYYVPGEFGIRIENMMYACPAENFTIESDDGPDDFRDNESSRYGKFLGFKNLTMVPYCFDLIDFSMLSNDEMEHLKNYYQTISNNLRHLLSNSAKKWFDEEINLSMN